MNKIKFLLFLTVVLTFAESKAQVRKCPAMAGKSGSCTQQGMRGPQGRRGMMQSLDLSDAQKTSMKSLRDEKQARLAELEKNDKMTLADFRSRREAINTEYKGKMENILTPGQKNRIAEEKKSRSEAHEKKMADRLEKMKSNLSLSDEQVNRIREHQSQMKVRMKAIHENSALGPEQKKMQMRQAREEGKKKMESILTPDQLKKQQEKKKERKEGAGRNHQGPRNGAFGKK